MSATRNHKAALKREALRRVAAVQETLRRWDPIGIRPGDLAPSDEYDSYASHIVSMVAQGCSFEQLCTHLGSIRLDAIGVEPNPGRDREIAGEILKNLSR